MANINAQDPRKKTEKNKYRRKRDVLVSMEVWGFNAQGSSILAQTIDINEVIRD